MRLIIFWDIDGTLLTTGRAGIAAWEDAAAMMAGIPVDFSTLQTAGLTDIEIARHILGRLGLAAGDSRVEDLVRSYETLLPDRLHRRRGYVLPGVREILNHICSRPDVTSLLLTGNTEAGARAKLVHYGLAGYFPRGAFADGCIDRAAIARRAVGLVRAPTGDGDSPGSMYVIGDTPHDIRCAKVIGARAIAVASGVHSLADLAAHDPWWALERLPAPEDFLERLGVPIS